MTSSRFSTTTTTDLSECSKFSKLVTANSISSKVTSFKSQFSRNETKSKYKALREIVDLLLVGTKSVQNKTEVYEPFIIITTISYYGHIIIIFITSEEAGW